MVRIHAAALLWAWAQISSGGNSGASAGSDTRALLTLLCTHEHDASRTSLAHLLMPLFTGVRGIGILGSSAHSWYSDVFCAMAHIHSPQAGVCCARCVASAVPREGAGQLSAFLLLEAGTL